MFGGHDIGPITCGPAAVGMAPADTSVAKASRPRRAGIIGEDGVMILLERIARQDHGM